MYEAQLEINHFLNRSSKWSSVSRARILEEERENSKDGEYFDQINFLSLYEAETLFGFN